MLGHLTKGHLTKDVGDEREDIIQLCWCRPVLTWYRRFVCDISWWTKNKSSTIDLSHTYKQVELGEDLQKCLSNNYHTQGFVPLQTAVVWSLSAPAISQRTMDLLLQGVKFTVCHLDDILMSGGSPEEHLSIPEVVFRRLQEHGIRLNPAKCIFFQSGLEFLGHWIDKNDIRPLPQKMDATMESWNPTNVKELIKVVSGTYTTQCLVSLCSYTTSSLFWRETSCPCPCPQ